MRQSFSLPRFMERQSTEFGSWCLRAPIGHTAADVQGPEYWVNILQSCPVKLDDLVTVIALDRSFCINLRFVEIDDRRQWAKTHLRLTEWNNEVVGGSNDLGGYDINHGGKEHKWRVMSPSGALVQKGFETREAALEFLRDYKLTRVAA